MEIARQFLSVRDRDLLTYPIPIRTHFSRPTHSPFPSPAERSTRHPPRHPPPTAARRAPRPSRSAGPAAFRPSSESRASADARHNADRSPCAPGSAAPHRSAVSVMCRSASRARTRSKLDLHDLLQVLFGQRMEHDDLIHAIQKLGPEVARASPPARLPSCARSLRPQTPPRYSRMRWLPMFEVMITMVFLKSTVRPWPSVSRPSSSICSITLNTSWCAFSISSNSTTRIGPPPHGFGQLPAFFVAHVSGRRADQPRHRVLLLIFRHVDADHGALVVEQELRQRARQFGLADARRPQKNEAADRPVGILQTRSARESPPPPPPSPLHPGRSRAGAARLPGAAASASRLPAAWSPARRSSG